MSDFTTRFEAAVHTLIGDGTVKQRLIHAYGEYLEDLAEIEFPEDRDEEFARLHRALHGVPPVGRESAVQASVQKMSSVEAASHARVILQLYRRLVATEKRADYLAIVDTGEEADSPPPFLMQNGG